MMNINTKSVPKKQTKEIIEELPKKNDTLRSPIICVMGHVDAGKTKLLDQLRSSNIVDKEAGGITQQIGSSLLDIRSIHNRTKNLEGKFKTDLEIPGFLMIDTPGHKSFSNLRTRGSSLCDIAIIVIDIMEGIKPQTEESIKLLKEKKVPFIIAYNKIDRIYGWKSNEDMDLFKCIPAQKKDVKKNLEDYMNDIKMQIQMLGLNSEFFLKNKELDKVYSIVPVSAKTGEGIPNLVGLIVYLVQNLMIKKLKLGRLGFNAVVMDTKKEEGIGYTADLILSDGELKVGEKIGIATGTGGHIITIRNLLTPDIEKGSTSIGKNGFIENSKVIASTGVKLVASEMEGIMVGSNLYKIEDQDDVFGYADVVETINNDIKSDHNRLKYDVRGVYIKASTFGSLEAFYNLLKESNIQISGGSVGDISRADIQTVISNTEENYPEYKSMLIFDIKMSKSLIKDFENENIKIFNDDVVYKIADNYTKWKKEVIEEKKKKDIELAVFPVEMNILNQYIFNKKNPLVFGVKIINGTLHKNTPIITDNGVVLGKVVSIEENKKDIEKATIGKEVCLKIEGEESISYGNQFNDKNILYSNISRKSIDHIKEFYREDMKQSDWKLMIKLKNIFKII